MRLPNAPSTPGPLDLRLPQAAAPQAEEEQHSGGGGGQGEASAAETEPQAAGTAAAARGAALEQLSDYVEASAVAAIEAAEARAAHTHRRGRPWSPSSPEPAAAGAAEAEAACGAREPSVLSHLALIHAYAKAGQLQAMFGAVERLVQVRRRRAAGAGWPSGRLMLSPCLLASPHRPPWQAHPGDPLAAAYHTGLPMAVDAVARSVQDCDAAFFLLEGWAKEVCAGGSSGRLQWELDSTKGLQGAARSRDRCWPRRHRCSTAARSLRHHRRRAATSAQNSSTLSWLAAARPETSSKLSLRPPSFLPLPQPLCGPCRHVCCCLLLTARVFRCASAAAPLQKGI